VLSRGFEITSRRVISHIEANCTGDLLCRSTDVFLAFDKP